MSVKVARRLKIGLLKLLIAKAATCCLRLLAFWGDVFLFIFPFNVQLFGTLKWQDQICCTWMRNFVNFRRLCILYFLYALSLRRHTQSFAQLWVEYHSYPAVFHFETCYESIWICTDYMIKNFIVSILASIHALNQFSFKA